MCKNSCRNPGCGNFPEYWNYPGYGGYPGYGNLAPYITLYKHRYKEAIRSWVI